MGITDADRFTVVGTAVIVGLGLGLSALHILDDDHLAGLVRATRMCSAAPHFYRRSVVGIISTGFDADDEGGPTLAAWSIGVLAWTLGGSSLPQGAYPLDERLFELPMIHIRGREHYSVAPDGEVQLARWS